MCSVLFRGLPRNNAEQLSRPAVSPPALSLSHLSSVRVAPPTVAGEGPDDERWCADGHVVEEFRMDQHILPYLFAFAIGEIVSREVGPRTRVYADKDSSVLETAAAEFTETEAMIRQGEKLFGEHEWERFDLLVLPPSFPYGGMENQRMVFLTPTVIARDGSGAQVVAHELAHSWSSEQQPNSIF